MGIADKRKVYVPYTVPGDVIEADIDANHGVLVQLLSPSNLRRAPPCSYFGKCGGCSLQHLKPDAYVHWKMDQVKSALRRERIDTDCMNEMILCAEASRRRIGMRVVRTGNSLQFGFHRRRTHEIETIDDCLILDHKLREALPRFRKFAEIGARFWKSFLLHVTLCENGFDIALGGNVSLDGLKGADLEALSAQALEIGPVRIFVGDELLLAGIQPAFRFGALDVPAPPGGFSQASEEGEAALSSLVCEAARGANKIVDLFCGVGTFSGCLSELAPVLAIDSEEAAIDALQKGVDRSRLAHPIHAERRNLFQSPLTAAELSPFDVIVLDPPRAGAEAQSREIAAASANTVISVSCNPATFSRDSAILLDGGYRLSSLTPVDQFVYGSHIELVGVFRRD